MPSDRYTLPALFLTCPNLWFLPLLSLFFLRSFQVPFSHLSSAAQEDFVIVAGTERMLNIAYFLVPEACSPTDSP